MLEDEAGQVVIDATGDTLPLVLVAGTGDDTILANSADDHTKMVFRPEIRGKTDQFLYKFRKPK